MAFITRGETGEQTKVDLKVVSPFPPDRAMIDDIQICCSTAEKKRGYEEIITTTRDEALQLIADLAQRLKTPAPLEPPEPVPLGTQLL